MAGAAVIGRPRYANFKVRSWFEANPFPMNDRLRIQRLAVLALEPRRSKYELVSGELSEESFHPHGSKQAEKAGQRKRADPVHAEHSDRLRVIAEHRCSALRRSPPQTLISIGNLPVGKVHGHVGIKQSSLIESSGRRSGGHGKRLGHCAMTKVSLRYRFESGLGQSRRRGGVLKFPCNINRKRSVRRPTRESRNIIEALLFGTPVVIDYGLAKMIAVSQWFANDLRAPRIRRFHAEFCVVPAAEQINLRAKFSLQRVQKARAFGSGFVVVGDAVRGLFHLPRTFHPRPRTHVSKSAVNVSEGGQSLQCRVDPAFERHIRRSHILGLPVGWP